MWVTDHAKRETVQCESTITSPFTQSSSPINPHVKVTYSSRWCLALELAPAAWDTPTDGGWAARYVSKTESSSICYIAVDQRKRGVAADNEKRAGKGPVLVVHASVPWSLQHHAAVPAGEEHSAGGGDDVRGTVQALLTKEAVTLVPELLSAHAVVSTKLHKWRFSQVRWWVARLDPTLKMLTPRDEGLCFEGLWQLQTAAFSFLSF